MVLNGSTLSIFEEILPNYNLLSNGGIKKSDPDFKKIKKLTFKIAPLGKIY